MLTRKIIDGLLLDRANARASGEWSRADALRRELNGLGVMVEDTAAGQVATGGTDYELELAGRRILGMRREIEKLSRELEIYIERDRVFNGRFQEMQMELLRIKSLLSME